MTDPQDLQRDAQPSIKTDQELHPPRRHDDPQAVVEEEERFGMAVPLVTGLIAVIFLVVIFVLWLT